MSATKDQNKYKKHELRDHIYELPDTYIGSIENTAITTYIYDDETSGMIKKEINYVPGLYKIFDEVLVNAIDQSTRLLSEVDSGKKGVKPVKNIHINIDKDTGVIKVLNDGDGIDIIKHTDYNDVWIPELIFGELLTSTNYNQDEEKLWGGKNGYGAKLANIFSKEFIVETVDHRRGLHYKQKFTNNMKKKTVAKVKDSKKNPYTSIEFMPDYERFGMTGLTDDIYELFRKRAYDACATTNSKVSIYFNNEKLEAKDFEKYAELYIGTKDEKPRVYEKCNDRWEVICTYSENGQFEQISFVNGINTLRGGKHVDYLTNQITKRLVEMAAKRKKDIKPQHIKDNLMLIVKSVIVNPSFDSQTKETLTTQTAKFGSKCELSDKFYDKLYKSGIIDKAASLTQFHEQKKAAKTDGKKKSRVLIPKLDDANKAGSKESYKCTLILTEGDSAKTMAIAGLSVIGRDYYGVFPLRGKILNVKDANIKKIADNEEITNLKKIMGLEQGKVYKDIDSLRYGKIMIMTDQDHDGSHIKGLLFNIFHSIWPSLFKYEDFLNSMLTPIIKVSNNGEHISFYSMTDYDNWKKEIERKGKSTKPWNIKYYKGLGTSTADEAKEYFRNMKLTHYKYTGQNSDEYLDLAFNKKRADDRKKWLMKYNRDSILDYTKQDIPYEEFVDKDLIHFSNRDLERSIPSICDGLKESTRKILYGCLKRKLYSKEIKVAQLSGYISEVSAYHHGEMSLQKAIIGMAQNYVGTNNINLMKPVGQFGTRIQGGEDSASPRYIHTMLTELAKAIFKNEDSPILKRLEDDGKLIEPEYYTPIIPMVLVNGGIGIGTGFSTNIPQHNPSDIIDQCTKIIDIMNKYELDINTKEDIQDIYKVIDKVKLTKIKPWYLGFQGTITEVKDGAYSSKGVWEWLDDKTLVITELPIGTWTEDYKNMLSDMIQNGSSILKDFENHYTDKTVKFILKLYPDMRNKMEKILETDFKLSSSKNLSLNNIHLYSPEGAVKKYSDTSEIIKEWSKVRLLKYFERKNYQLKELNNKYKLISAKVRFIQEIIDNTLNIMNRKEKDVEQDLIDKKYLKLAEKVVSDEEENETKKIVESYDYLTGMPIKQLTYEKKKELEKEAERLNMEIKTLKSKTIHSIWSDELDELKEKWETYRENMEDMYIKDAPNNKNTKSQLKKRK